MNRIHSSSASRLPFMGLFIFTCLIWLVLPVSADLVFSVADDGDSTTTWTISGSGTTGEFLGAGEIDIIDFGASNWTTDGEAFSTGGSWNLGANSSDAAGAGDSSSNDRILLSFSSDIFGGTDLSGISGSVELGLSFANMTLPVTLNSDPTWGNVTIQAVPEPSPTVFAGAMAAIGLGMSFYRRRRCSLAE